MKTIGILGGGQLGCMLAESLYKLGAIVFFYDPNPNSPAFYRTERKFIGEWNDSEKLMDFFSKCDLVTYEFENVSVELLDSIIKKTGVNIIPSPDVLKITKNRIFEKNFLKSNNFPVCFFKHCSSFSSIKKTAKAFQYPYIIKTILGGYDGIGQQTITNDEDFANFLKTQSSEKFKPLVFEEKIELSAEASCIVAVEKSKNAMTFPILENMHNHHILYNTILPCNIPIRVQDKIKHIALLISEKLNITGLVTVEFFITKKPSVANEQEPTDDNYVYVNELAPRPHNSGHVTRNACSYSQFDALARILLEIPLQKPRLNTGYYCMGNLLGDIWLKQESEQGELNLDAWKNNNDVIDVVIYGKTGVSPKRKMGHFVTFSEFPNKQLISADKFRKDLCEKTS